MKAAISATYVVLSVTVLLLSLDNYKSALGQAQQQFQNYHSPTLGINIQRRLIPVSSRRTVIFPSGVTLNVVVNGPVGIGEEHYDPNNSQNPLLETSGDTRKKWLSRNFNVGQFARSGTVLFAMARIDPKLVRCIQAIRDYLGTPVIINSGYRSYGYNVTLYRRRGQRPTRSQHSSGRACDIRSPGKTGLQLARAALHSCGCNIGLGLARDYLHVDVRGRFAVWRYGGLTEEEAQRQIRVIRQYRARRCS